MFGVTSFYDPVIIFWIQPSDSNFQAGFLKKNSSAVERGV